MSAAVSSQISRVLGSVPPAVLLVVAVANNLLNTLSAVRLSGVGAQVGGLASRPLAMFPPIALTVVALVNALSNTNSVLRQL
jgi:hypothetical protein